MPYYAFDPNSVNSWDFEEEIAFSNYLKDRSLPNLKTVAVPFEPYDIFNETSRQSQHKRMWLKARKVLLEEVDRRGVKLRELKHWEQGECLAFLNNFGNRMKGTEEEIIDHSVPSLSLLPYSFNHRSLSLSR